MTWAARGWAAVTVMVSTVGVLIELGVVIAGVSTVLTETTDSLGVRLWHFVSYFTIQSNVLVLAASITLLVNPARDGEAGRGMISVAAPGASFALPIGDVIDAAAETTRLEKALARTEKDASGLRGRLSNPKFARNADPEVIEETRAKLAELDEDAARTRGALEQLRSL